jgi:predicted HTH transcriptional regulator
MATKLRQLIASGENDQLDFKQTISSASKIAKTIVSFANHKGGKLLIGVRDNKTIAGVRSEDEKYMLDLAAHFFCKPEIELTFNEIELEGKVIIEADIPEGNNKPYYAKDEEGKWWVYIRHRDKSILASKITVEVLKKETKQQDTFIQYGPKEQGLIEYLSKNERITLKEYCKKMNISKWRGMRIIIKMISAGIIRAHTHEKTEFYTLI